MTDLISLNRGSQRWIQDSVARMNLSDNERWVTLMFDEMKIQNDLVSISAIICKFKYFEY
jgi:hypothetical protein